MKIIKIEKLSDELLENLRIKINDELVKREVDRWNSFVKKIADEKSKCKTGSKE